MSALESLRTELGSADGRIPFLFRLCLGKLGAIPSPTPPSYPEPGGQAGPGRAVPRTRREAPQAQWVKYSTANAIISGALPESRHVSDRCHSYRNSGRGLVTRSSPVEPASESAMKSGFRDFRACGSLSQLDLDAEAGTWFS